MTLEAVADEQNSSIETGPVSFARYPSIQLITHNDHSQPPSLNWVKVRFLLNTIQGMTGKKKSKRQQRKPKSKLGQNAARPVTSAATNEQS